MDVDNKFRSFTKVKNFEEYKEMIKEEISITSSQAKDAKALMRELQVQMTS